ncbi:nucleolar protein 11 [Camelus ferus]|nr:nucleolar protein 11 [Camelus ferus]
MAALEEEFTLTAVPLGSGPDGPLGVEPSDKTDQFLVTDSGRTVILYKLSAEVYRIHSIQGTEPLVLFKEGAVRSLEALLEEPQQKIETVISDEEVIKMPLHMEYKISDATDFKRITTRDQRSSTHAIPHFVNWEASQESGLGSQNSEQSKRIKESEKHIEVELRKFLAIKRTPDFHTIIGDTVIGLLERCKTEPSFYPRNSLMQLIQTHVLSYSLCPGLMEIALEKTDVQMLQLCLQQFPDIPESVTCACLKIFLGIGDDSLQETDINMESVSDYANTVQGEKMEEQAEILQNGFNLEEDNCENCAQQLSAKPQAAVEEAALCPVIPKRAALLLWIGYVYC